MAIVLGLMCGAVLGVVLAFSTWMCNCTMPWDHLVFSVVMGMAAGSGVGAVASLCSLAADRISRRLSATRASN